MMVTAISKIAQHFQSPFFHSQLGALSLSFPRLSVGLGPHHLCFQRAVSALALIPQMAAEAPRGGPALEPFLGLSDFG